MDVVLQSENERLNIVVPRENVVAVNGKEFAVEIVERRSGRIIGRIGNTHWDIEIARLEDRVFAWSKGRFWSAVVRVPPIDEALANRSQSGLTIAPMPGVVVAIHAAPEQVVQAGSPLVTIESMKMQIVLSAERDGVVETVDVRQGMSFAKGALLVSLASTERST